MKLVLHNSSFPSEYATWLPSAEEMRLADEQYIQTGIASFDLMHRAAQALAHCLEGLYYKELRQGPVLLLCGPGNNGGDGVLLAKILRRKGYPVQLVLASAVKYSRDCKQALDLYSEKYPLYCYPEIPDFGSTCASFQQVSLEQFKNLCHRASVCVDALLGNSQTRAPEGTMAEMINIWREGRRPGSLLVSIDIPTGCNASTGAVYEPHMVADCTLAIQFVKRGQVQFPARAFHGDIHALPIGIPAIQPIFFELLHKATLPKAPARAAQGHKGSFGHGILLAGSADMPGACALSSQAALYSGIGKLSVLLDADMNTQALPLEVLRVQRRNVKACAEILSQQAKAFLAGPGMGQDRVSAKTFTACLHMATQKALPTVLDADALNFLAKHAKQFQLEPHWALLTPHPGEAALLLGCSVHDIEGDRYTAAQEIAKQYKATVLLKGASSIIFQNEQGKTGNEETSRGRVHAQACPALASGGSGDILSGILLALLAQRMSLFDAACLGVWIHAQAARHALAKLPGKAQSMMVSSILSEIPALMHELSNSDQER